MLNLKEFINKNELDLSGSDSELNSNCTVLCGYALYININDIKDLLEELIELKLTSDVTEELERIFLHASYNNYGDWWEDEDNRDTYITE